MRGRNISSDLLQLHSNFTITYASGLQEQGYVDRVMTV